MTDRDAQVRRLAEAVRSTSACHSDVIAQRLYDAGARMPEPAPPTIVVSEEAIQAYLYTKTVCSQHDVLRDYCSECREEVADGLRAAFPIMLRDTVNARANDCEEIMFIWENRRGGGSVYVPADAIIRTLVGAA